MPERSVAVLHAAPAGAVGAHWGDTHFASSLAAAFDRAGWRSVACPAGEWARAEHADAVVVLRGRERIRPPAGSRSVLWVISHHDTVSEDELDEVDHVCVASTPTVATFAATTTTPVHVLHQATDLGRFRPVGVGPVPTAGSGVVVVANHRWPGRRGPRWLRQLGIEHRIVGRGWEGTPEARSVASPQMPNDQLAGLYATADLVVADQWEHMGRAGFVANRLFDVAASGGAVASDDGPGVREVFGDLVPTWSTRDELGAAVAAMLAEPAARRERAGAACDLVRSQHGFEHRAAQLLELLTG